MKKIHYNTEGWVCNRYPYSLPITNENLFIEVSEEEYEKTRFCKRYHAWKVVNGNLKIEKYEEQPVNEILEKEKQEILIWLSLNDWIPNKILREEWTKEDQRWIDYKNECQVKRKRLDEIDSIITKG